MKYENGKVSDLKIAYIGGGSRGWAWGLMSDLALCYKISGTVYLYDIDKQAAKDNEVIGNSIAKNNPDNANFKYVAADTYEDALTNANFVIISVLPGTFDEMESDVHSGEKYGIYQSVGDTAGIGGVFRALRALPIFFEFAEKIKEYCPNAFVINYTNPMALCVGALYKAFPEIKCFGCCHEVFGTQDFLCRVVTEELGIEKPSRNDIKINVVGVNHFTWFTKAYYKDIDLFPVYSSYCNKHGKSGVEGWRGDNNWVNKSFTSTEKVKMDLFLKYGYIAAAGDRHLAEFCPPKWYLKDPETVSSWDFGLTSVKWRKEDLQRRLERKDRLLSGEEKMELEPTGEEGVHQMCALLGLNDFVTNVNLPNYGQIPNLPIGAIVETNARFSAGDITPVFAGNVPMPIKSLIDRNIDVQQMLLEAAWERNLEKAFIAFITDTQNILDFNESRKLFDEMFENTIDYLQEYI